MIGTGRGAGSDPVEACLVAGMPPLRRKLEFRHLQWILQSVPVSRIDPRSADLNAVLSAALLELIRLALHDRQQWVLQYTEFQRRVQSAPDDALPALAKEFSRQCGESRRQIRGDRSAFERWMGADALADRQRARLGRLEHRLCLLLERLAAVAQPVLSHRAEAWHELDMAEQLGFALGFEGQPRVLRTAIETLLSLWTALPDGHDEGLPAGLAADLNRFAEDSAGDPFLRASALALVAAADGALAGVRLVHVMQQREVKDGEFLRARALSMLQSLPPEIRARLLEMAVGDPSIHVRQQLARACLQQQPIDWGHFDQLLEQDGEATVRAAAADALLQALGWGHAEVDRRLLARLSNDSDLKTCRFITERLRQQLQQRLPEAWQSAQLADIDQRLQALLSSEDEALRRAAINAREWLWLRSSPATVELHDYFAQALQDAPLGRRRLIRWPRRRAVDPALLARVLACSCQSDFGLDFRVRRAGVSLLRGEDRVWRFWRFFHEWRHPEADKRAGFLHTIGRRFVGDWVLPSGILAEQSPTKVPGEPRSSDDDVGDRNFLPLLDHVLSALDSDWPTRPLRLVTAFGTTVIHPPHGLWSRLRSKLSLSLWFEKTASLRDWTPGAQFEPKAFVSELARRGVRVEFLPRQSGSGASAGRFFSLLPIAPIELWNQFSQYAVSLYQNTLSQLALFLAAAASLFLGRHAWLNQRIRQARAALPLVLGGWGTRGKSGTERLKAALFSGLGYQVFSKTTGCEAMFLHGHPFQTLREMFLYRPYDKATIWEHAEVMKLAAQLQADVFLWECMGLNPDYVEILQRQWSRDDLSTLTNTYPDHEDIQGPSGRDIPDVMGRFIPQRSELITTEEEMLPVVRQHAKAVQTPCEGVDWSAAWLLPQDLLQRFPYQEHPSNIALVLAMARRFAIAEDEALKLMADHVVADLGVLKTSPAAQVRGRLLEFSNGMSANERRGCLSNWQRLGLDRESRQQGSDCVITVLVNNRGDRIPRSRVFARIMLRDLSADHFVLIGSHLDGLRGFLDEAWQELAPAITLWPPGEAADPLTHWKRLADRLRIPTDREQVEQRLKGMLRGLGLEAELANDPLPADLQPDMLMQRLQPALESDIATSVVDAYVADLQRWKGWDALAQRAEEAIQPDPALDALVREQYRSWFEAKLIVVKDSRASGDQIIDTITRVSTPGLLNRIHGVQNIKGTGLDFVYRWQHWESCHRLCQQILRGSRSEAQRALTELAGFAEFSLLTDEMLRKTLDEAKQRPFMQGEALHAELDLIESNRAQAMAEIEASLDPSQANKAGGENRWLDAIEEFLDTGDAVRRRRRADRIYTDLKNRRVSHTRAANELMQLVQRQKGGWLREWLGQ